MPRKRWAENNFEALGSIYDNQDILAINKNKIILLLIFFFFLMSNQIEKLVQVLKKPKSDGLFYNKPKLEK
jgi:hypothetical protein